MSRLIVKNYQSNVDFCNFIRLRTILSREINVFISLDFSLNAS
jgi:hypothetical protein